MFVATKTYIDGDAGDGEHTLRRRLLGEVAVELLLLKVPSHRIQIALMNRSGSSDEAKESVRAAAAAVRGKGREVRRRRKGSRRWICPVLCKLAPTIFSQSQWNVQRLVRYYLYIQLTVSRSKLQVRVAISPTRIGSGTNTLKSFKHSTAMRKQRRINIRENRGKASFVSSWVLPPRRHDEELQEEKDEEEKQ